MYPREIEEVFMTHPAVAMVAVIGIPHQEYGEDQSLRGTKTKSICRSR